MSPAAKEDKIPAAAAERKRTAASAAAAGTAPTDAKLSKTTMYKVDVVGTQAARQRAQICAKKATNTIFAETWNGLNLFLKKKLTIDDFNVTADTVFLGGKPGCRLNEY